MTKSEEITLAQPIHHIQVSTISIVHFDLPYNFVLKNVPRLVDVSTYKPNKYYHFRCATDQLFPELLMFSE